MSAVERFTGNYDASKHRVFAGEVRAELGRNRISITKMAEEAGYSRTTINLWLLNNTTQARYDVMMAAIKRIVSKKGESL